MIPPASVEQELNFGLLAIFLTGGDKNGPTKVSAEGGESRVGSKAFHQALTEMKLQTYLYRSYKSSLQILGKLRLFCEYSIARKLCHALPRA